MRIWHYELIDVLPNAQLKAMRYELGDMIKQYPNIKHGLVKYANDYSLEFLMSYFIRVLREFDKRGINHRSSYDDEIISIYSSPISREVDEDLFYPEHNDRYLKQCYYNLQEKADRRIISSEEWKLIHKKIYGKISQENIFKVGDRVKVKELPKGIGTIIKIEDYWSDNLGKYRIEFDNTYLETRYRDDEIELIKEE